MQLYCVYICTYIHRYDLTTRFNIVLNHGKYEHKWTNPIAASYNLLCQLQFDWLRKKSAKVKLEILNIYLLEHFVSFYLFECIESAMFVYRYLTSCWHISRHWFLKKSVNIYANYMSITNQSNNLLLSPIGSRWYTWWHMPVVNT